MKNTIRKTARIFTAAALIMLLCFCFYGCNGKLSAIEKQIKDEAEGYSQWVREDKVLNDKTDGMQIIGTRAKPEVKTYEGIYSDVKSYPYPGNSIENADAVAAIRAENLALINGMYEAYAADTTEQVLSKHIAGDLQLGVDSAAMQNEPRVDKRIILNNKKTTSPHITGLYAPAGEVITIMLPEEAVNLNIMVTINVQTRAVHHATLSRMPDIKLQFTLNKAVNKIGTPYGGGITLYKGNISKPTDIVIGGAVQAPYFRLGGDDIDSWNRVVSSAGGVASFDSGNVIAIMPSTVVRELTDPAEALTFWRSVNQIMDDSAAKSVFDRPNYASNNLFFDSYVPAGAAVAFVEANFACFPTSWAGSFFNTEGIIESGGWGLMHEMAHNHQTGWGIDTSGEVTNNALNSMCYMLLTNISAARKEINLTADKSATLNEIGRYLPDWNYVASSYYSLKKSMYEVATDKTDYSKFSHDGLLPFYVNLIHSFGTDKFRELTRSDVKNSPNLGLKGRDDFIVRGSQIFGYDLTDYASLFKLDGTGNPDAENPVLPLSAEAVKLVKDMNLPVYYPLSNLYASGKIIGDKSFVTERPFEIELGAVKTFDFVGYTLDPRNAYTFKGVEGRQEAWKVLDDGKYEYTPTADPSEVDSFKLRYECKDGTAIYLSGEIRQKTNFASAEIYLNVNSAGMPFQTLNEAEYQIKSMEPTDKKTVSGMTVTGLSGNKNSVCVTRGKFVPAVSGQYKLYMINDDMGALYLSEKQDFSDEKKVLTNDVYVSDYKKSKVGVYNFTEGKEYYFKFIVANAGGNGGGKIGYVIDRTDENTQQKSVAKADKIQGYNDAYNAEVEQVPNDENLQVNDIPNSRVVGVNVDFAKAMAAKFKPTHEQIYRMGMTASDSIGAAVDSKDFKVLSAPLPQGEQNMQSLVDGDRSTSYHSLWSSGNGEFPQTYTVDMGQSVSFNYIDLVGIVHQNPTVGNYEIFVSDDNLAYKQVYKGVFPSNIDSQRALLQSTVTARYFRVFALDNHGVNYTCFADFIVGNTVLAPFITPVTSNRFEFEGKWRARVDGVYINGKSLYGSGSTSIKIYDSQFTVYGDKFAGAGKMEILLNGKKLATVDCSADSKMYNQMLFYYTSANAGDTLTVKAVKGDISLGYITTGANMSGVEEKYSHWSGGNVSYAQVGQNYNAPIRLSVGQIVLCVFVGGIGGAALIALLLFLLIFPIINRLFGTRLPGIGMFDREYEDEAESRSIGSKGAEGGKRERASVANPAIGDDRYVKTVRIDKLFKPTSEAVLTSAKIDSAVRETLSRTGEPKTGGNKSKDAASSKAPDKREIKPTPKITPTAKTAPTKPTADKKESSTKPQANIPVSQAVKPTVKKAEPKKQEAGKNDK